MSWRVALALDTLLDEVNVRAPRRSKISDGSIGDPAHSSRVSQHNPDANGVVRARDYTDDPAKGHDATEFAEHLRRTRDKRILYVIDDMGTGKGRMFSSYPTSTHPAWTWRPYSGPNTHARHTHVSVVSDPRLYDSTRPWGWANANRKGTSMFVVKGDSGPEVRYWQRRANRAVPEDKRIVPDGDYGPSTATLIAHVTSTEGDRIGPVQADRIEAAIDARNMRRTLRNVPQSQVDIQALADEVANELTVKVVRR